MGHLSSDLNFMRKTSATASNAFQKVLECVHEFIFYIHKLTMLLKLFNCSFNRVYFVVT